MSTPSTRREWLASASVVGVAGFVAAACSSANRNESEEEDVAPPEDLMRGNGLLNRVLLVYDEALRRIDASQDLPPEAVRDSAGIVRSFIEDYHEKLEEDQLFP